MDQPDVADFSDLNSRQEAFRGVAPDAPPRLWTPEHVQTRLIEAFAVLRRWPGRVGPTEFGCIWPTIFQDFEEFVDTEAIRAALLFDRERLARLLVDEGVNEIMAERDRRAGEAAAREAPPTADENSRAEEALQWAVLFLGDKPMHADALQIFALCHAYRLDIAKVLRRRALRADRLVVVRQADEDDLRARRRRDVVAEPCAWANTRLEAARDADHARNIRANAVIRAQRAIEAAGDAVKPIKVRRRDVMPGKCFSRTRLDAWRKEAAALVSGALNRRGIVVR
jgi:hypothetical protein